MTSTSVFNNLTSGLLTRSRSGVVQIIHYRRSKKQRQINDEEERKLRPSKWKAWLVLKRQLNNLWFLLGGENKHLNTRIVRDIWRVHIGSNHEYFVKVVQNACKRNSDLETHLIHNLERILGSKELAITKIAENFYTFFDTILSEEVLKSPKQIREMAYDLGRKHTKFLNGQLNITHWDTLNLAMMDELEETGLFDEVDLRAFQKLIFQINDYMFMGYTQMRELIAMNDDGQLSNNNEIVTTKDETKTMRRSRTYE